MRNRKSLNYLFLIFPILIFSCEDHSTHDQHQHGQSSTGEMQRKQAVNDSTTMSGMSHQDVVHSEMLQLTPREQLLAGIHIDTVKFKNFQHSITVLGEVAVDENTISVISAKINGRIDKLYLRNPGETIFKGQALFDIYSETLYAEQLDLLRLIQNEQSESFVEGARNKLMLHGLTKEQIVGIEKSKVAVPEITFYSNEAGYLSSLNVREGDYVETGESLFGISSIDFVRVNAQLYPGEIQTFSKAFSYEVETGGMQGKFLKATVVFDNPSLENNSKVLFVRLRVKNTDHFLRPGMMTTVKAITDTENLLVVPKNALIMESNMIFIWVQEKDGMFSRRMILIGKENKNVVEVKSGLNEGDIIVISGSYLLNSEYILRKGANSMGGMKM